MIPKLIITIIITLLINKFIFFIAYIPSPSMVPTLNIGDRVLATRVYNYDKLKRNDVIIFKSKELKKTLVKRLIGLPGDKLFFYGNDLYINGKKSYEFNSNFEGTFIVPYNKYFFLGDNSNNSFDSRYWKNPFIDEKDILGKVQIKIWPLKDIELVK